jgi:homoserine dehydrogenase
VLNVGLLGFGTIGAGVVRLLREHRTEIAERAGMPIRLTTIADLDVKTDRGINPKPARLTTDAAAVLQDPAIDVVIELIGGYEPARRFVLAAIENGKDVVTANKALLAVHGDEIVAAAERRGDAARLRGERRWRHPHPARAQGRAVGRPDDRRLRHRQRDLQPHPHHHDA